MFGSDRIKKIDLQRKWEEMIENGEGKFIWIDTILKVFLPLALVLITVDYFFFTKNQINQEIEIAYSVKFLLIILVGFLEGKLDWQFFQRIFGPSVNTFKDLRKRYLINNGVLTFGLPFAIINFRIFNSSFIFEYLRLSIWLIIGVVFGTVLWFKNKEQFENVIND